MKARFALCVVAGALLGLSTNAAAAIITLDDITLGDGAGFSYTQDGLTLNVSASNGGQLFKIASGDFTGLWIGQSALFGTYTFDFSVNISSVEIEFDALGATNNPPETIGNFGISSGPHVLTYINQVDTTLDGATITATLGSSPIGDGQGIFSLTGSPFVSFNFDHAQHSSNNGFVIERITVNTVADEPVPESVPEPATLTLLGVGLLGAGLARRRAHSRA